MGRETMVEPPRCLKDYKRQMITVSAGYYLASDTHRVDGDTGIGFYVSEFRIGICLVTVAMYEEYCQETGAMMPPFPEFNPGWRDKTHPVVNVQWEEARAYADWAMLSLPTEAQWERAVIGSPENRPQFRRIDWSHEGFHTIPAGYGISPAAYGLLDLECGLWEWCADWYQLERFEGVSRADPEGPPEGKAHVLRGCSGPRGCRERCSNGYVSKGDDWGFRLVSSSSRQRDEKTAMPQTLSIRPGVSLAPPGDRRIT
jgi:formylglycine-generating enzyme